MQIRLWVSAFVNVDCRCRRTGDASVTTPAPNPRTTPWSSSWQCKLLWGMSTLWPWLRAGLATRITGKTLPFRRWLFPWIEPKSWRILNPFGTRFCRPCLVTTLSSCMGQKTFERGCILWVQKWVASIKPLQPPRTTWKPFIAGSWFAETCCRRIGRNKLKRQTGWSIWIRMAEMSFFFQSCTWQADPWAKARWCSSRLSMSRSCHRGLKVTPFQGCHSPSGKAKNFSRPQRWWRNGATSVHVNICRPWILDVTFKNSLFLFLLSPYRNSPSLLG